MNIKIKYFSKDYPRLEKLEVGNWIDLRVDKVITHTRWEPEVVDIDEYNGVELVEYWHDTPIDTDNDYIRYKKGDILFLGLGVAMELPKGYEAYVVARSSTFKKTGLILTNGQGIIDNAYCGDNDEWKAMVYATRDGIINRHQRLFQFRIQENMPELNFIEVDKLGNKDRGGYGSTGEMDKYYFPEVAYSTKYGVSIWKDNEVDSERWKRGLVFRTKQEAINCANEMIALAKHGI